MEQNPFDKLAVTQMVKKLPAFNGTKTFITVTHRPEPDASVHTLPPYFPNIHSNVIFPLPRRGWEFFSSPPRPDRLWGPPSLIFNMCRVFFPRG
jgi:hypothetical protein